MVRRGGLGKVFNRYLEPININSVLVAFNVSLLETSQLLTDSRSRFNVSSMAIISLLENVRCVSSAYILGCELNKQFDKSLIYIKNNNGPKIVP